MVIVVFATNTKNSNKMKKFFGGLRIMIVQTSTLFIRHGTSRKNVWN